MDHSRDTEGLRNAGLAIIAIGVVLAGLVYGRNFLLPLAISILVWNLFADIDLTRRLPGFFASAQSFLVTLLLVVAYVGFLFVESGIHLARKRRTMS